SRRSSSCRTCSAWPSATCRRAGAKRARSSWTSITRPRTVPCTATSTSCWRGGASTTSSSARAAAGPRRGRSWPRGAGKDVYSEKPCGLTIAWCQALDDTIRQTKRVFQAGTQRRSVANFQAAVQLAHSGKLGKLHTLYASVYMPSVQTAWLAAEPTPPRDVVDWDLWLGPAPWRPYNKAYVQGGWRGYWDFDSGARLLD